MGVTRADGRTEKAGGPEPGIGLSPVPGLGLGDSGQGRLMGNHITRAGFQGRKV